MKRPPNILVVMSDDHGPWALQGAGCAAARTPAMNWLSKTGCRFTHAFTPSPVCSPARASFFTGLIPSAHGIHDWIEERAHGERDWLGARPTLAQRLQAVGYETALIGKWHCGRSHVAQPGFAHWFSYAKGHQFPHLGDQSFVCDGKIVSGRGRQSRFLFDHARSWLRARPSADKPFFLFYAPVDTHSPFADQPKTWASAMRGADFSDIPYEPGQWRPERRALAFPENEADRREHLSQYLAAVGHIDEQLGGLIDTLDEMSVLDETLVLYTSDHGHMNGHHGLVGKGNASLPQNFYDESIRVPSVARLPGTIKSGSVIEKPVDHCDWFKTLLDLAAVPALREDEEGPGATLRSLWANRPAAWREDQVCEYGNARMIRTSSAKLIVRNPVPGRYYPDEFYDLAEDPRETVNCIGDPDCARVVTELRSRLERYFARWEKPGMSGWNVDRLPEFNPAQAWEVDARLYPRLSS